MPRATADWPLLLVGPMLRRVTANAISVFIATSAQAQLTLIAYSSPDPAARSELGRATAPTRQIGTRLHVAVVTVSMPAALEGLHLYGYDLRVTEAGTTDAGLNDLGMLDGALPLGYVIGHLPGFVVPPSDPSDIHLLHSSCRKPHGEGVDALPLLDDLLEGVAGAPSQRPQQLFLTGDQIYADDVSAPLLAELMQAGDALLGRSAEVISGVDHGPETAFPGARQEYLGSGITSDRGVAVNHLIRLSEFAAMYLYSWSDALWPSTLPGFDSLPQPLRDGIAARYIADSQLVGDDVNLGSLKARWAHQTAALSAFSAGVGKVRRLFANIATYMICDDHEISDDWFLDRQARATMLEQPASRRMLTNGLAAYAVFQAWGNTPERFNAGSAGADLLSALSSWGGGPDGLASIEKPLGLTGPGIGWDYRINFPAHRVIVLDTRTHRGYHSARGAPDLISLDDVDRQAGLHPGEAVNAVTIIVSAAPLLAPPLVRNHEGLIAVVSGGPRGSDQEPWLVRGRPAALERLLEILSVHRRVVVLAGDVHYASTQAIRYLDNRTAPQTAAIAHCVSSAAKNQDAKTKGLAALRPGDQVFLGWSKPGYHLPFGPFRLHVGGTPAVWGYAGDQIELRHDDPPEWRYSATYCRDVLAEAAANQTPRVSAAPITFLEQQVATARVHRQHLHNSQMTSVVGVNNVGELTFAFRDEAGNLSGGVAHRLWFRVEGVTHGHPYTVHYVDLTPPIELELPLSIADLAPWSELMSFRPPAALQTQVLSRTDLAPAHFHRIEAARGLINLDYYAVNVTTMPKDEGGSTMTPTQLLNHFRRFLNESVDNTVSTFATWSATDDTTWIGPNPLGAVLRIRMFLGQANPDDGDVVVTEATEDHWTFSTFSTDTKVGLGERDWGHPVSGNRQFGYTQDEHGVAFFTRGADRCTSLVDLAVADTVFGAADKLWRSLQQHIYDYVTAATRGGAAEIIPAISQRYDWGAVSSHWFHPHGTWL